MYNVSLNDKDFVSSDTYMQFMNNNPGTGYLKIRAYSANQAVPIQGLKIFVNKKIDGYNVNFFEGYTNESGVIENISLPTPIIDGNDLIVPLSASYEIMAILSDNTSLIFNVKVYDKLYVIQNINVVPKMSKGGN